MVLVVVEVVVMFCICLSKSKFSVGSILFVSLL